jgi:hypothetical protein
MFADGTQMILQGFGVRGRWTNEKFLQRVYIVVLLAILPIAVYFIFGQPVALLQTAGAIEAAHIPIVTGLTLYLNRQMLPKELQPSKFNFGATAIAGIFFLVFAVIYLLQLTGAIGSSGSRLISGSTLYNSANSNVAPPKEKIKLRIRPS